MSRSMSSGKAYRVQRRASDPPKARLFGNNPPTPAYHATGVWGKRGMTLQELTRAFDAFNEDEERVAIGFASSEDCNRKLAEPLSGVKTVFSDLDGLKPSRGCSPLTTSSPVARASWPVSSRTLHSGDTLDMHELGCLAQASDNVATTDNLLLNPDLELTGEVDDETIKPSHKRRRGLSMISPIETPCFVEFTSEPTNNLETDRWDLPARPPSRMGFADVDIDGDEDIPSN